MKESIQMIDLKERLFKSIAFIHKESNYGNFKTTKESSITF